MGLAHNAVLIPVGRSGGHAGDLYPLTPRPSFARDAGWDTLADPGARPEQVAEAVTALVRAFFRARAS